MIKERIVPKHIEKYIVCDYCGEEIDDYSSSSKTYKNGDPDKHFHSMYAGGSKGTVKKTCLDLYNDEYIASAVLALNKQ
jgi:ribosomal protein L31